MKAGLARKSALEQTADRVGTLVTDKTVKTLACDIFRQLQAEGCAPRDIISVSSQLIDLVTGEIQKDCDAASC